MYIEEIVSDYYNMPLHIIYTKTRKREIVQVRQLIMWLLKEFTNYSLAFIGQIAGGKDHATVLHARKTIQNLIDTDSKFRNQVNEITVKIKESSKIINNTINYGDSVWVYINGVPTIVTVVSNNTMDGILGCRVMNGVRTLYFKHKDVYLVNPDNLYGLVYIEDVKSVKFNLYRIMKPVFLAVIKVNFNTIIESLEFITNNNLTLVDNTGLIYAHENQNTIHILAAKGNPELHDFTKTVWGDDINMFIQNLVYIYPDNPVTIGCECQGWDCASLVKNSVLIYNSKNNLAC